MRKVIMLVALLTMAGVANAAPKHCKVNKANETKHTIKVAARPFKALGRSVKNVAVPVAQFSFAAFDTMVVDPLGVALQAFADGVDMFVAAPLESLPGPFEAVGDGVHYVYLGVDKVGQVLAK